MRGLFAGFVPTVLRAAPSNAAIFYVYEEVSRAMKAAQQRARTDGVVIAAGGVERIKIVGGAGRGHGQSEGNGQKPHVMNSPASAWRIIAAVSAQPNKAAKEPKRGPWLWPSSTSYKAANQARKGSKPCVLPTS